MSSLDGKQVDMKIAHSHLTFTLATLEDKLRADAMSSNVAVHTANPGLDWLGMAFKGKHMHSSETITPFDRLVADPLGLNSKANDALFPEGNA